MEKFNSGEFKKDGLDFSRKIDNVIMDIEEIALKYKERGSMSVEEFEEMKRQMAEKSAEFNLLEKKLKEIERGIMDKNDNGIVGHA